MPFQSDQIERALDAKAEHLQDEDLLRVAQAGSVLFPKFAEFPPEHARAKAAGELLLAFLEHHSRAITPAVRGAMKQAAGALIYLTAPIDLVPDEDEDGYADDAAVVLLACRRAKAELDAFAEVKKLTLPDFG